MSSAEDTAPRAPPQPEPSLSSILDANQYDQTIQWLKAAQLKAEEEGDIAQATLMAAAHQVCVVCHQLQDVATYHQQTYQQAITRKKELEYQLEQLWNLWQQSSETAGSLPPISSKAQINPVVSRILSDENNLTLWQRLQGFIKRWLRPASSIPESMIGLNDADNVTGTMPASPSLPTAKQSNNIVEVADKLATPEVEKVEDRTETAVPHLVIYCLGPFRAFQDDQPIDKWTGSKGKLIFKYMLANREQSIAKEILMDLFWPDADPDAARNNLNVAIYGLRQTLRNSYQDFSHLLFEDNFYLFNPELQIWTDFETFVEHAQVAQKLDQDGQLELAIQEYHAAETLYNGEFLAEDRYEEWLIPLRQYLQDIYLNVLDKLSSYYFKHEEYAACVTSCRQTLAVEPCRESTHRRLMRCYSRQNQHYLGIRQYHQCLEVLKNDLDVDPTPQTTHLYEQIRNHQPV